MKKLCEEVQAYIVEMRRSLHKIPEIGVHLPKTQEFLCKELDKMGVPYKKNTATTKDGIVDCGIVALIEGKNTDKVLAIRSDMDALPITELHKLSYSSEHVGTMHACGHDAHMAMLLGTVKVLQENKKLLNGSIKIFFQSSEELLSGAQLLIAGGCMENPTVTACIGTHVWPMGKSYKAGIIAIVDGPVMASGNGFVIRVKGSGCHGSMPHLGIDPIVIAAQIILSLQSITSREISANDSAVLSICQIHAGTAGNIIPEEVLMEGTIRTLNPATRAHYIKRVKDIVTGTCTTMGTEGSVEWTSGTPAVVNEKEMTNLIASAAKKILGEDAVAYDLQLGMGNEDFAYYQEIVPSAFMAINVSNAEKMPFSTLHNPKFQMDEDILWKGTAVQVQTALDYLK